MIGASAALTRLRDGNCRFVEGVRAHHPEDHEERRRELLSGQAPFAVVLGCSDSRVPAEIVFDQGLGDLFVIRVAGNIVAPSLIGSVEFAADRFDTRLVVVLGHSRCGAVLATLEDLRNPSGDHSPNLRSIVDRIRPAVAPLLEHPSAAPAARRAEESPDHGVLVREAVRANVRASVAQLRRGSPILERLIRDDGLVVTGAEYDLESGVVTFLDEPEGMLP